MAPLFPILLTLMSLAASALAVPFQLLVEWRENRGRDPHFHVFHCARCRCFLSSSATALPCPHCGAPLHPLKV
jgi:hypothetical protein